MGRHQFPDERLEMRGVRTDDHVELLRRNGLRATGQRLVILAALDRLGHATMEQLLEATKPDLPNLQLSTIYRSVETLTAHSIVSHTHLNGPTPTYQLTTHADHAHLVCRGCRSVTEMDDDVAHRFTADIARVHGFDVDFGHLSVFGRCASCVATDLHDDASD
jgi:Fur family ferric uptake transcriptional regulator